MTTPGSTPARLPAWSLPPAAIWLWATQGLVGTVLWGAALTAAMLTLPTDDASLSALRWAGPLALGLYAVGAVVVRPLVRHRVHRWEVTAEAVYALTGWLTRTWTLVPIARIQTVDVTRSVVQQVYGLASIAVLTASSKGTVQVPHLPADVAERVAADLARRAEHVRDEAT